MTDDIVTKFYNKITIKEDTDHDLQIKLLQKTLDYLKSRDTDSLSSELVKLSKIFAEET